MVNWEDFLNLFFLGAMGALSMEILKVYELKGKLHHKKYQILYKSILFWSVIFLFILVSGFLTWAIYENNHSVTTWQIVLTGMGISSIGKKIGETLNSSEELNAGTENIKISLKDLFV